MVAGNENQFPNWSVRLLGFPFSRCRTPTLSRTTLSRRVGRIPDFISAYGDFVAAPISCGVAVTAGRCRDGAPGWRRLDHGLAIPSAWCSARADVPCIRIGPWLAGFYPLARWISPDGVESFGHLTTHPRTEGVYGKSGTVQDYIDQQPLAPFFAMSDRYGKLYQRMIEILERLDPDELDRRPERRAAVDELPAGTLASMWVDIDATIAEANGSSRDQRVSDEGAIDIHIEAIEVWIDSLEARLTAGWSC